MTQDHLLQNIIIQQGGAIIGGQMVTVEIPGGMGLKRQHFKRKV